MPLSKQEWLALEKKALDLRKLTVQTTVWAGSGHFGGGMSVMDLLTVLYHKYLNIKVDDPKWEDRDRFILSQLLLMLPYFVTRASMMLKCSSHSTFQVQRWVCTLTQTRL